MEVRFYATLRPIAGARAVPFPFEPGTTVRSLLDRVVERFPAMREQLLDADGALYGHVHVFLNGRDAPYLDRGLETPLSADDAVDIFPAVGGG